MILFYAKVKKFALPDIMIACGTASETVWENWWMQSVPSTERTWCKMKVILQLES